jgi:predicted alpha/beta superfamily hydrolase
MKAALLGLSLAVLSCAPARPCPQAPPVAQVAASASLGETFRLASPVLGEERVVNVYLPPDYATGTEKLPVLYALDGGMKEDFPHVAGVIDVSIKNGVIRPMIVVGIENTERRRDLVSATTVEKERPIAPHAGGTARFRRFLREELKPEIARRYRASGESSVVGESFAGLFIVETLLLEPDLFDAYVAIDPSVWWSAGALVKSAPERLARWSAGPKRLVVSTADYAETNEGVASLMDAIHRAAPAGLTATLDPLPAEHHSTIFPVAEVRAYRLLFAASK